MLVFPTILVVWFVGLSFIVWRIFAARQSRRSRLRQDQNAPIVVAEKGFDESDADPAITSWLHRLLIWSGVGAAAGLFLYRFSWDGVALLNYKDVAFLWTGIEGSAEYILFVIGLTLRILLVAGLLRLVLSSGIRVPTNHAAVFTLFGERWRGQVTEGLHFHVPSFLGVKLEEATVEEVEVDDTGQIKKDAQGRDLMRRVFIYLGIFRAADTIRGAGKAGEPQPTLLSEWLQTSGMPEWLKAILPDSVRSKLEQQAGGPPIRYRIDFRARIRNAYRWLDLSPRTRALIVKAIQDPIEKILHRIAKTVEYSQAIFPSPHVIAWCNAKHLIAKLREYETTGVKPRDAWEMYLEYASNPDPSLTEEFGIPVADFRIPKEEDVRTPQQVDDILDRGDYKHSLVSTVYRELGVALYALSLPDPEQHKDVEEALKSQLVAGIKVTEKVFEGQQEGVRIANLAKAVAEVVMERELKLARAEGVAPEIRRAAEDKLAIMTGEYMVLLETLGVLKSGKVNLTALGGMQGLPQQFLGALAKVTGIDPTTSK